MTQKELNRVLDEHSVWLRDNSHGTRADLSYKNLARLDLRHANLFRANLCGVNLEGAFLMNANLERTDLEKANLQNAMLFRANLNGADLGRANLTGADLGYSGIAGSNLVGANLTDTKIGYYLQPGLLKEIAGIVLAKPEKLNMNRWESDCGAAFCLAGWAVHLNRTAWKLKLNLDYEDAGLLTLGPEAHSMFFKEKDKVLEYLEGVR